MAHKNDYSCIVFFQDGKPKKWTYVHKLQGFADFLNAKHKGWQYFNVYDRRNGTYLKRFYPSSIVPPFLALLLFLNLYSSPLNSTFKNTFKTFNSQEKAAPSTFINGFNNTATIPTPEKREVLC
jgi:hypothetical protein